MDLEFMGSAEDVPMELPCRRWISMPTCDPNSPPQYAHLKPNEIGNFFRSPGIPPSAARRTFELMLIFASLGVVQACTASKTFTPDNTWKIHASQCTSMDASLAWMYSRHGRLQGQNVKNLENRTKCQNSKIYFARNEIWPVTNPKMCDWRKAQTHKTKQLL